MASLDREDLLRIHARLFHGLVFGSTSRLFRNFIPSRIFIELFFVFFRFEFLSPGFMS